jgi:hypothetical protein
MNWTSPCYGVTYFGSITDYRWVTVVETKSFARLSKWSGGFSHKQEDYDSVEEAKAAGEKWVREG